MSHGQSMSTASQELLDFARRSRADAVAFRECVERMGRELPARLDAFHAASRSVREKGRALQGT